MPGIEGVPPCRPGMDKLKVDHLNAMLYACQYAMSLGGGGLTGGPEIVEAWLGQLCYEGPDSEADHIDERYWVQRVRCKNTGGVYTTPLEIELVEAQFGGDPMPRHVTATNLAEWQQGTHLLWPTPGLEVYPKSSPVVLVTAVRDQQTPPIKRYYFDYPVREIMFPVRVWQDGGTTDGDHENQCDRTYTACTLPATAAAGTNGQQLGIELTPQKRRPVRGRLSCPGAGGGGVIGLGYYYLTSLADGVEFYLYDANETLGVASYS